MEGVLAREVDMVTCRQEAGQLSRCFRDISLHRRNLDVTVNSSM